MDMHGFTLVYIYIQMFSPGPQPSHGKSELTDLRGSGAALALENAVRARFGAASAGVDSALEKAVRACFGAAPASAFEKAV